MSPEKRRTVLLNILALDPNYDRALAKGFRYLAGGHFSSVFRHAHTPGVVYKISTGAPGNSGERKGRLYTDGWVPYAYWCIGQTDPHLPRIYGIRQHSERCYVAAMEELLPAYAKDADYERQRLGLAKALRGYSEGAPELAEIGTRIRQFINAAGFKLDFHEDNAMLRESDGMCVVTDPASFKGSERDARKFKALYAHTDTCTS